MGITTTHTQKIVFAALCCLWAALYSPLAHAQNPPCAVAGDAGNFYESCASNFCEGLICNGSAYATLSGRNFSGWESVKFGNDTSTCNSTRSGRLRYAGGSTWEYCNGTAWTALVSGGSVTWPQSVTSATGGDVFRITGSNHNFLGFSTDANNSSVFVGREAGNAATAVSDNTFVGYQAGKATNTTGSSNSFIGSQAGSLNTTGTNNTFLGMSAGKNNTTGGNAIAIGFGAATGPVAGYVLGSGSTIIGYNAGYSGGSGSTGTNNTFVGSNSGSANTTASGNSFIGSQAGANNTTGGANSFVGYQAGRDNSTGINNTFLGQNAGLSNTTGSQNTFIGMQAGSNATASNNSFIGYNVGIANSTGNSNTFVGTSSGSANTTGSYNSFFGMQVGTNNSTGANNTFLGYDAGRFISDGTTALTAPTANILIGSAARGLAATTSYFMNIGGALYGTYDDNSIYAFADNAAELLVDGILGVGYRNPTCNATYEGYMRYNNTTKKMQYCNATAWTDM